MTQEEQPEPCSIQTLINHLKDNIIGLYVDIDEFHDDLKGRAGKMVSECINDKDVKTVENLLSSIKKTKQNVLELDMLLTEEISNKVEDAKEEQLKTELEKEGIEEDLNV